MGTSLKSSKVSAGLCLLLPTGLLMCSILGGVYWIYGLLLLAGAVMLVCLLARLFQVSLRHLPVEVCLLPLLVPVVLELYTIYYLRFLFQGDEYLFYSFGVSVELSTAVQLRVIGLVMLLYPMCLGSFYLVRTIREKRLLETSSLYRLICFFTAREKIRKSMAVRILLLLLLLLLVVLPVLLLKQYVAVLAVLILGAGCLALFLCQGRGALAV